MSERARLVSESESRKSYGNLRYGLSLYEADGGYTFVMHSRTYDGIRVTSRWDSGHIKLTAQDQKGAWAEAVTEVNASIKAFQGLS